MPRKKGRGSKSNGYRPTHHKQQHQLKIGGRYLHDSYRTLWKIKVFGFRGEGPETSRAWKWKELTAGTTRSGCGFIWFNTGKSARPDKFGWDSWICWRRTATWKAFAKDAIMPRKKGRGSKSNGYRPTHHKQQHQLKIGGRYLHVSYRTLWKIKVFGFRGEGPETSRAWKWKELTAGTTRSGCGFIWFNTGKSARPDTPDMIAGRDHLVQIRMVDVGFSPPEPCAMLMLLSSKTAAHDTLWMSSTTFISRTLCMAHAIVAQQEAGTLETLHTIHYLLVTIISRAFLACPSGICSTVGSKLLPGTSLNICTLFACPRPVKNIGTACVHCGSRMFKALPRCRLKIPVGDHVGNSVSSLLNLVATRHSEAVLASLDFGVYGGYVSFSPFTFRTLCHVRPVQTPTLCIAYAVNLQDSPRLHTLSSSLVKSTSLVCSAGRENVALVDGRLLPGAASLGEILGFVEDGLLLRKHLPRMLSCQERKGGDRSRMDTVLLTISSNTN